MVQEAARVGQERPGQGDRLGLVVVDGCDGAVGVDVQDRRAGAGQQDRRVGGDDELAALVDQLGDAQQQGQASVDGQGRLRLVEQVQPLRAEPMVDQVEE
ncbi:hypothetical protein ABT336_19065 [Micromonospora sp. NPDC000207]|uniref:hypothetical protein n=1 Tax=Micromonospora sp. NPDC000207 TaxID=3154246 RepID=UPI00332037C0